jgi:beta-galactosidase/beta-glucuronidase
MKSETTEIEISKNWNFTRTKASKKWLFDESLQEEYVNLPHCWNDKDGFQDDVDYYRGWGSYKKFFSLEESFYNSDEYTYSLVSEGFYGTGDVWLNKVHLGKVDGQYIGFEFDITDLICEKENCLCLRLTNSCSLSVLPGHKMPDFLLYGGMSGRIFIRKKPVIHFNEKALFVESEINKDLSVTVSVSSGVIFSKKFKDKELKISWKIFDDKGVCVADTDFSETTNAESFRSDIELKDAELWDIDNPYMYEMRGVIKSDDKVIDSICKPFGIRAIEFRPNNGFFLNGERVDLKGCNRHESMPGFGSAMPDCLHYEDAYLIKRLGLNFVRLSHYPQNPSFLDACDRLGILVLAELASWKSVRGGKWLKNASQQMEAMIRRDRNHPSIILWGMGNEGRHKKAYSVLYKLCKRLDSQRFVIYAENHFKRAKKCGTVGIPDVWGSNYEFDMLQEGCEASKLKNVIVTECSNNPDSQRGDVEQEGNQVELIKADLENIKDKPFVAGFCLWCFNDYSTLRKKRYIRYSGLVDAWRIPKLSARWFAEQYAEKPEEFKLLYPLIDENENPAKAIVLHCEKVLEKNDYEKLAIMRIKIVDAQNCTISNWNGHVNVSLFGEGYVNSYTSTNDVMIYGGEGRAFVSLSKNSTITVSKNNLSAVLDIKIEN